MRYAVGVLLLVAAASLSCTDGGLTRARASELIQALDDFKRVAYLHLPIGAPFRSTFRCESQASIERDPVNRFLIKQGWVRYGTRPALVGIGQKEDCPILLLTPAGVTASAQWTQARSPYPDEAHWRVPIGSRTLSEVTGLTAAPDGSTFAEFHWKWTPNKLGETLQSEVPNAREFFERTRKTHASCRSGTMAGGVSWVCGRIRRTPSASSLADNRPSRSPLSAARLSARGHHDDRGRSRERRDAHGVSAAEQTSSGETAFSSRV